MKAFFKEIFEYHHNYNLKFIDQLAAHAESITERSIPLMSHNLNAHLIWNRRILENPDFSDLKEVYTLEECLEIQNVNHEKTLTILDSKDLNVMINYSNSKGQHFEHSIRDILFHVANHTTHHRGQIISDLRSKDIAPHVSDYIYFKR